MKYNLSSKLVNYILLYASHINDISLYHGKAGLSLAMFLYSRRFDSTIIERFASDLLYDVYDNIHKNMPYNIEHGLAGIGLAITYMYKLGFVECDLNDVLSELDAHIMSQDPRRINDFSFRTGALGIVEYIKARKYTGSQLKSIDESYIEEISEKIKTAEITNQPNNFVSSLTKPKWGKTRYLGMDLDVDGGVAYYILREYYDQLLFDKQ